MSTAAQLALARARQRWTALKHPQMVGLMSPQQRREREIRLERAMLTLDAQIFGAMQPMEYVEPKPEVIQ